MFKFDVYFRNILSTLLVIWYHKRHSLNIKIFKKLNLTVQKGVRCCMYPCASSAASRDSAVKLTPIHTNSGLHIKTCE